MAECLTNIHDPLGSIPSRRMTVPVLALLFIQHPFYKIGAWEQNGDWEEPYFGAQNVKVADCSSPFQEQILGE